MRALGAGTVAQRWSAETAMFPSAHVLDHFQFDLLLSQVQIEDRVLPRDEQLGILFARFYAELFNQRKDETVVFGEQLSQMSAAALGVPEHAQTPLVIFDLVQSIDGVVYTEELVILARDLGQTASGFVVQRKVLDPIQQTAFVASAANQSLQRDNALFALAVNAFPVCKMFPASVEEIPPTFS